MCIPHLSVQMCPVFQSKRLRHKNMIRKDPFVIIWMATFQDVSLKKKVQHKAAYWCLFMLLYVLLQYKHFIWSYKDNLPWIDICYLEIVCGALTLTECLTAEGKAMQCQIGSKNRMEDEHCRTQCTSAGISVCTGAPSTSCTCKEKSISRFRINFDRIKNWYTLIILNTEIFWIILVSYV